MMRSTLRSTIGVLAIMGLAEPASAIPFADTVNSFVGGTGFGVFDNGGSYVGPSGSGVFDPLAVTALDGGSLGLGGATGVPGVIVMSFSTGAVIDGIGNDIRFYDTFGFSEGLSVEASVDGITFVSLGSFSDDFARSCNPGTPCVDELDLLGSGLTFASYFRLTALQGQCVTNYPECYDLDALEAINFESDVVGVPEPLTLALFGTGLAGLAVVRRRRKAKA